MSKITQTEFDRAMALRSKDFETAKMSIEHDSKRLAILDKKCNYMNRFADICEKLLSRQFLVTAYLAVLVPLFIYAFAKLLVH